MSRRAACSVAGGAVLVLLALLFVVPVDYAALGPGPACNTVGDGSSSCPSTSPAGIGASLISVPAADDHPSTSHLSLLTVSEDNDRPTAGSALLDWLRPGHAIVPREVLHPPGQSSEQVRQQDSSDMIMAQDSAVVAAEQALGLVDAQVAQVTAGPAQGVLRAGDLLLTVDGQPVADAAAFVTAVAGTSTTRTYAIGIERDGTRSTVSLHKAVVGGKAVFGIAVQDAPTIPVTITLNPQTIGGPSAGLMFALGVYDRLTPGNLAGDAVVAGTGTIGADGTPGDVGAIGGIAQKLYAARHDVHATLFLAPQSNCGDTRGAVPAGLQVVPVSTFAQALAVLAAVRAGQTAGLPHC